MNPVRMTAAAYLRWRHSKGYGVHSPFAYRLITLAVNPARGYGFYGYQAIDSALESSRGKAFRLMRHDARLLLRVASFLRIRRVLLSSESHKAFSAAVVAAGAKVETASARHIPQPNDGDMLVAYGSWPGAAEISRRMAAGSAVFAIDPEPESRDAVVRFLGNGLLLEGKRIVLVVPNKDMVFTRYSLSF